MVVQRTIAYPIMRKTGILMSYIQHLKAVLGDRWTYLSINKIESEEQNLHPFSNPTRVIDFLACLGEMQMY